jgi:hypothetical protein
LRISPARIGQRGTPLTTFFQLLLIFLFPLAVYCLTLAMINRRPQPVMVPGTWDCVGLIFALSGFLMIVGPYMIHDLFNRYERSLPFRDVKDISQATDDVETMRWAVLILYCLVVVGGVTLLVWWRRKKTIVYNANPDRFYHLLARILGQLGYGQPPARLPEADEHGILDLAQVKEPSSLLPPPAIPLQDLFEVEIFAPLSNVTMHWRTDDVKVRQQIEDELRRHIAEARLDDNPAGTWIMGIAAMLFSMSFLVALAIILGKFLPPRGM